MRNIRRKKQAQVAIFVIIAILIVAALLLFFLLRRPTTDQQSSNPEGYIRECIKDATQDAVSIILENGGDIEPELTIMYGGKNFTYLCYNQGYYKPCINQRPMLIEHIEQEITEYIEPIISDCFSSLRQEFGDRDYQISMGKMEIKTELQPKRVVVNVERELTVSKGGEIKNFKNFEVSFVTPLYELSEIAMEIVNQEAEYCNFENLGFMIIYPEYGIRKENVEGSLIYTVKELQTEDEFKFAVRGCVMPVGL